VLGPGTVVAGTHPDGQLDTALVPITLPETDGTGQHGWHTEVETGLHTVVLGA
jgi:hypothetical protein